MSIKNKKWKQLLRWAGRASLYLSSSVIAYDTAPLAEKPSLEVFSSAGLSDWKEYHSSPGNCSMMFPGDPEHISEKMAMPEEGFELKYDAYISASPLQAVFMLLIAQYPSFVDETYAQLSLEAFLNGILTHNASNQLLFSDTLLVYGHEALDFFIRTGNAYFKGRAIMIQNSLYLMAMECEIPNYDESHYKHFVGSFKLHTFNEAKKSDLPK